MTPLISVIVPVYNDLSGLKTTIGSLRVQDYDSKFNILVANDGGDVRTREFCNLEGIHCIEIYPNAGSYNARNQAILQCDTPYLAFLDADSSASTSWLSTGVKMLEVWDYVAGNVVIPERLVRDIATFHDFVTAFPIRRYFDVLHFGVTANLFVRRDVFDNLGLFDSGLRSGGDVEFGDRVYRSGKFTQCYSAECVVYHPPRSHSEKVAKLARVGVGQSLLRAKYPERFGELNHNDGILRKVRDVLPPSVAKLKSLYKKHPFYTFTRFYFYSYRLKLAAVLSRNEKKQN